VALALDFAQGGFGSYYMPWLTHANCTRPLRGEQGQFTAESAKATEGVAFLGWLFFCFSLHRRHAVGRVGSKTYPPVFGTISGTYTVTVRDAMSHQSSVGFGVIRDTTPPTLTLAALVQGEVHVTWSATDPDSGVDASTCLLEVREDEGAWQTFSTQCGGDDTHDGQPGHTYTLRLSASDNVSNAASLEVQAVFPYVTKYYYANGQRVAMRQEGVVYYIHSDHLGSTSLTTDQNQQVEARQLYHLCASVCQRPAGLS
jgi:hypothetical protein